MNIAIIRNTHSSISWFISTRRDEGIKSHKIIAQNHFSFHQWSPLFILYINFIRKWLCQDSVLAN